MPAEPFLGEIFIFPYNFAPRGYAQCDGQLLAISQNTALFSILGTTYGGDGQTTFALPDMRSRVALHAGQGPGLHGYSLGEMDGVETVTLNASTLATHDHQANALHGPTSGTSATPQGQQWAYEAQPAYAPTANGAMAADASGVTGGNQPHENRPPVLALNYCIALVGVFPSRN